MNHEAAAKSGQGFTPNAQKKEFFEKIYIDRVVVQEASPAPYYIGL
jgi:hypothetical protein